MRWPAYFILVYLTVGLQIGAGESLRVHGARPDLVLLAVIFICVNAPRDAALLGAFGIGLVQDLVTLSPLGLYALAYSLAGLFAINSRELLHKGHPLAQFFLAFAASLAAAAVVLIHGWIKGPSASFTELTGSAAYTALLAPVILTLLNQMRKGFGFKRRSRAY